MGSIEKGKISSSAIESTNSTLQSHQPQQQCVNAKCGTYGVEKELPIPEHALCISGEAIKCFVEGMI
jgi:hypothetical protein